MRGYQMAAVAALGVMMVPAAAGAAEAGKAEPHYVANREPLLPSAFIKLPIGSITPRGWLRHTLRLEADGMTGHLAEISRWCKFEENAWASPEGAGQSGWEELPYWLKGYGDLGYVLKDERITAEARRWIEAVLASQREDGWFGPRALLTSLGGKADLWPHMVMLNVLQSFHEATGDPRVLPLMTRYFRWQLAYPDADFLAGFWPKMRAGDNLESVYWLYNRTGEPWLLDLARKIHVRTADWTEGIPTWHGVNLTQGFRQPAVFYVLSRDKKHWTAMERNYDTVMEQYGQFPGGGFGADENCRPGYTDPRQGFETCSIVEFMHSAQMLTKIRRDPVWADRCEEMAFNTFPASMTPDLKALHYLTGANMVRLDRRNHSPGIQNRGNMLAYSPGAGYRCCQHNVSHGWPYYAEELWLATPDRGLCASLYAPCEVKAKVGDGTEVTIAEETDYPFGETVTLKLSLPGPARFPLHLRIPGWCENASVQVNGKDARVPAAALSYAVVDRQWRDGDVVTLRLPMPLRVRTWEKSKGAVSVHRGPLAFSLRIGEEWRRCGGSDAWPDQELLPTTPWNYGLVLDPKDPAGSFEVMPAGGPPAEQPFTLETAPVRLTAKAKKIPAWQLDRYGLVAPLQESPARSDEPEETVTLVPMGCARLRISAFPTIDTGPGTHEWSPPPQPDVKAEASHCWDGDSVDALSDGQEPKSSNDQRILRMTWWSHRGTDEWVQYTFPKARKVSAVAVYWFDDTGVGQCRVPLSWKLLCRDGDAWEPVEGAEEFGVAKDAYNRVSFTPVETTGLRIEVRLQPGFSGGVLEWKVE